MCSTICVSVPHRADSFQNSLMSCFAFRIYCPCRDATSNCLNLHKIAGTLFDWSCSFKIRATLKTSAYHKTLKCLPSSDISSSCRKMNGHDFNVPCDFGNFYAIVASIPGGGSIFPKEAGLIRCYRNPPIMRTDRRLLEPWKYSNNSRTQMRFCANLSSWR